MDAKRLAKEAAHVVGVAFCFLFLFPVPIREAVGDQAKLAVPFRIALAAVALLAVVLVSIWLVMAFRSN